MANSKLVFAEKIKNCIAKAELKEAIGFFLEMKNSNIFNQVIVQSSRYQFLNKSIIDGTINNQDIAVERNKIAISLLELVDQLEMQEMPANTYNISTELEDVLALAETESRRNGEVTTPTRYFFAALVKLRPNSLKDIIEELENIGAFPEPISNEVASLPRIYSRGRKLSACLTDTANHLEVAVTGDKMIQTDDFFVDVAKFGHGNSVQKLRSKGIDKSVIENYVDKYGLTINRRLES